MKWSVGFFLALLSYFFLDQTLTLYIYKHVGFLPLFKLLSLFISPPLHLFIWSALTLCALTKRYRDYLLPFAQFMIMMGTVMFIAGVLKIVLGRARPDFFVLTDYYGFSLFKGFEHAFRSFPSSHAAAAFGIVHLWISLKKPKLTIIWYLIACGFSSLRLFSGHHFISDLIVGGMLGIFAAKFTIYCSCFKNWFFHRQHPNL